MLTSLFAHSLFFKEQLERFAPVAFYKRATVSDSLTSIFRSQKNELFPQETDEQIPYPEIVLKTRKKYYCRKENLKIIYILYDVRIIYKIII